MKNLIEFSIHGDIYLFLDSLSEEEFAIVSAYVKKRLMSRNISLCIRFLSAFGISAGNTRPVTNKCSLFLSFAISFSYFSFSGAS